MKCGPFSLRITSVLGDQFQWIQTVWIYFGTITNLRDTQVICGKSTTWLLDRVLICL